MKTNHAPIPAMAAGFRIIATAACLTAAIGLSRGQGPIDPGELVAPKIEIAVNITVQPSVYGRKYQLQVTESLATGTWQNLGDVVTGNGNVGCMIWRGTCTNGAGTAMGVTCWARRLIPAVLHQAPTG